MCLSSSFQIQAKTSKRNDENFYDTNKQREIFMLKTLSSYALVKVLNFSHDKVLNLLNWFMASGDKERKFSFFFIFFKIFLRIYMFVCVHIGVIVL